jgi:hypothetical protein
MYPLRSLAPSRCCSSLTNGRDLVRMIQAIAFDDRLHPGEAFQTKSSSCLDKVSQGVGQDDDKSPDYHPASGRQFHAFVLVRSFHH